MSPLPRHCSSLHGGEEEACKGVQNVNLKQRRTARLLAGLLKTDAPDLEAMTFSDADRWIAGRWREWMAR